MIHIRCPRCEERVYLQLADFEDGFLGDLPLVRLVASAWSAWNVAAPTH